MVPVVAQGEASGDRCHGGHGILRPGLGHPRLSYRGRRRVGLHRFTARRPYLGDLLTLRVSYNPYLHTAKAYHPPGGSLEADPEDTPLVKLAAGALEEEAPEFQRRKRASTGNGLLGGGLQRIPSPSLSSSTPTPATCCL
jgi:hypothetical protein